MSINVFLFLLLEGITILYVVLTFFTVLGAVQIVFDDSDDESMNSKKRGISSRVLTYEGRPNPGDIKCRERWPVSEQDCQQTRATPNNLVKLSHICQEVRRSVNFANGNENWNYNDYR